MSEAAQRKEKQKWTIEKPKLDNVRRLRSIYFIDPADAQFKETILKRTRKVGSSDASSRTLQKPAALLAFARQNTLALLRPMNLRESVWKELYIKIMKTTWQGKESTH